jgi:hypothetical protein
MQWDLGIRFLIENAPKFDRVIQDAKSRNERNCIRAQSHQKLRRISDSKCRAPACEKSKFLERDGEAKPAGGAPPEMVSGAGADAVAIVRAS